LVALLFPAAAGVYFNGMEGLFLLATTIISAMLFEYLFTRLLKRKNTLTDLSAAVSGTVLALVLPISTPLWVAALAALIAVIVVKGIYGGLGQNFINPAVAAKLFAITAYGRLMTTVPAASEDAMTRLIGQAGGNLGEASIIAIIIGGAYLIFKGVIRVRIPVTIIIVAIAFSAIVLKDPMVLGLNGSVYLTAFFLANDYASSAITNEGKWVYAALIGLLGSLFIGVSENREGIYYALVLANIFAPFIDGFFKGKVNTDMEATA
jgi:Na+-translocating ferredoxin:NAD+ oxidoreductase RnfD subunit